MKFLATNTGRQSNWGNLALVAWVVVLSGCAEPARLFSRATRSQPTVVSAATEPQFLAENSESHPSRQSESADAGPVLFAPSAPPAPAAATPPIRLVSDPTPPPAPIAETAPAAPRVAMNSAPITTRAAAVNRKVVHASQANFDQHVLESDVPVLVDFYAPWCGPCKALSPTLDQVAQEAQQARVVKVNIDDNPDLAARYGVQSIPSLLVFKEGRVVARRKGVVAKPQLLALLDD